MKLLIITQVVDREDPILGFFVGWIEEIAKRTEHIDVICLKKDEETSRALPANVRVRSLGKEHGREHPLIYSVRFLLLVWRLRHDYDAVFVHMNQEYVLLAGWLWRLLGKRVYMWRNHYAGSWRTDIAAMFCTKIFCTSQHSYTAKYRKTVLMPVGVDTRRFTQDNHATRMPHSILFLARMSPAKRPEMLIDALALLKKRGVDFSASFVGSPLPKDEAYYQSLTEKVRSLGLAQHVSFRSGVPQSVARDVYHAHEIFVNTSPSGMLDKTIFEAAACGCQVLTASADFATLAGRHTYFDSSAELAEHLATVLAHPSAQSLTALVEENSLSVLARKLIDAILAT